MISYIFLCVCKNIYINMYIYIYMYIHMVFLWFSYGFPPKPSRPGPVFGCLESSRGPRWCSLLGLWRRGRNCGTLRIARPLHSVALDAALGGVCGKGLASETTIRLCIDVWLKRPDAEGRLVYPSSISTLGHNVLLPWRPHDQWPLC